MKVKDVDALREQISEDPREAFTKHQVWLFASVHNKTVPTIEAIPKDDVVAMLEELKKEIKELWDNRYDVWLDNQYYIGKSDTLEEVDEVIQEKIDKLKEVEDGN